MASRERERETAAVSSKSPKENGYSVFFGQATLEMPDFILSLLEIAVG
jgi:hypothetical protein